MWRWPLGRVVLSVVLSIILIGGCLGSMGVEGVIGLIVMVGIGVLIAAIAVALTSGGKRR
jgi:hypothetical protein